MLHYVIILNKGFPLIEPSTVDHIELIIKHIPLSLIQKVKVLGYLNCLVSLLLLRLFLDLPYRTTTSSSSVLVIEDIMCCLFKQVIEVSVFRSSVRVVFLVSLDNRHLTNEVIDIALLFSIVDFFPLKTLLLIRVQWFDSEMLVQDLDCGQLSLLWLLIVSTW